MKIRTASLLALTAFGLVSCVAPRKPVEMKTSFDPKRAAFALEKGSNAISGQGFLRQQGGAVVTCAGSQVLLIPVTPYSTERMLMHYGNDVSGYAGFYEAVAIAFDPQYEHFVQNTVCDAQGNFSFKDLANGEYFIGTSVIWMAGEFKQGGTLMRRVKLHGGESQTVMLTQ